MSKLREKKIQKLRREIEELNKNMTHAATVEEWREINAAELYERDSLQEDLSILETFKLQERAAAFGVNVPELSNDGGVIRRSGHWDYTRDDCHYLSANGRTYFERQIIEARFNYWKRWIELVTPIASTIISIIALLLAALALYLQVSSDPIIVVPPPQ